MSDTASRATSARLSRDWPLFASGLAAVLAAMREDQFLIISVKQSNRFIQFAAQGTFGMRAEIGSNAFLPKADHLSDEQIAALTEAGWHPPTGSPSEATPENDPDGSPNFFIDYATRIEPETIAKQAMLALAGILRVPHPGFLEYEAFEADKGDMVFPELGIKRLERGGEEDQGELAERLLAAVRDITGIEDLDYDQDGDIGIRFGSVSTLIRLVGSPAYVRFLAPLLREVRETPQLYARLNGINGSIGHMHLFYREGTICAISDMTAAPIYLAHLATALRHFCEIANGLDDLLEAEFGGRATVVQSMPNAAIH